MNAPPAFLGLSLEGWRALPLPVRLMAAASFYLGGSYTRSRPACPFPLPGPWKLARGKATNCSTMTACLLGAVYPSAGWTADDWKDLQVWDAARLDSPVAAIQRRGVGHEASAIRQGLWYLVQGWRSTDPPRGHAFFIRGLGGGMLAVLQASSIEDRGPTLDQLPEDWLFRTYGAAVYLAELEQ